METLNHDEIYKALSNGTAKEKFPNIKVADKKGTIILKGVIEENGVKKIIQEFIPYLP